ncbi:hypothetical protein BPAE_0146g00180 [Botrytis paeoniae]|uniref:Uncharacterized protein n=1 Tax=Botrytis paeoniae TaxID=278948 RepID=A0A4Z1FHM9_9HELO|nr:hypothetical protein BPAE_0146g00180 [Botrytis paeoniae]
MSRKLEQRGFSEKWGAAIAIAMACLFQFCAALKPSYLVGSIVSTMGIFRSPDPVLIQYYWALSWTVDC